MQLFFLKNWIPKLNVSVFSNNFVWRVESWVYCLFYIMYLLAVTFLVYGLCDSVVWRVESWVYCLFYIMYFVWRVESWVYCLFYIMYLLAVTFLVYGLCDSVGFTGVRNDQINGHFWFHLLCRNSEYSVSVTDAMYG